MIAAMGFAYFAGVATGSTILYFLTVKQAKKAIERAIKETFNLD